MLNEYTPEGSANLVALQIVSALSRRLSPRILTNWPVRRWTYMHKNSKLAIVLFMLSWCLSQTRGNQGTRENTGCCGRGNVRFRAFWLRVVVSNSSFWSWGWWGSWSRKLLSGWGWRWEVVERRCEEGCCGQDARPFSRVKPKHIHVYTVHANPNLVASGSWNT